ncbi:Lipase [Nesidiocoris tenuis]|uniref:Lipase n=1 Tax=Nesidiocoris tenuis TaxID=355587 RepID=A0ABN7ARX4_9HEMI|nr:Lipase [Nesidiocoris tenuis]
MDFMTPCLFLAALYAMAGLSHQGLISKNSPTDELPSTKAPTYLERLDKTVKTRLNPTESENVTEPTCYPELGCFPTSSPWFSLTRPLPGPAAPEEVNTALYLFTRNRPNGTKVMLWPKIDLEETNFNTTKPTIFITHGFASNTSNEWMHDMKDAYLENMDANVFMVDWGKGAKGINYLRAASNTRIVGAELGRFGRHIVGLGQQPDQIHAVGHSLGAHISGYFGKRMASINSTIGRITALDPAQPGFEVEGPEVKLTKNDAKTVDVLHTDARPFIPFFGFGMLQPAGDIDFYINGGALQPGCYTVEVPPNITSLADLATMTVETLSKWVSCSHGRSYEYFTWSLKNKDCFFVGRKMTLVENVAKVGTLGTLTLADPIVDSIRSCTKDNCNILGFLSSRLPARGAFAVTTNDKPPFCKSRADEMKALYNTISLGVAGAWDKIKTPFTMIETPKLTKFGLN